MCTSLTKFYTKTFRPFHLAVKDTKHCCFSGNKRLLVLPKVCTRGFRQPNVSRCCFGENAP